jgi:hypothetical protein
MLSVHFDAKKTRIQNEDLEQIPPLLVFGLQYNVEPAIPQEPLQRKGPKAKEPRGRLKSKNA